MKRKPLIIFILLAITTIAVFINVYPNFYAYQNTPQGFAFSGQASWFDPWDINVYVAAIKYGQTGQILLENLFTSDKSNGLFIYPIYTASGFIFRSVTPFLLFHLEAMICGFIFCLSSWILISQFLKSQAERLIALYLFIFGGGLGWLFFNRIQSSDLYITGFISVSQLQRPHEAIGMILYFCSLVFSYKATVSKKFKFNLISLFFLILTTIFYPYYYLSYFLICGIFSGLKYLKTASNLYLKYWLFNFIFAVPILWLYYRYLSSESTFGSVLQQQLATPNIVDIALGYGVLLIFLFIQFKSPKFKDERLFLNIWLFASLFLSYLPLGISRFYLRGLYFPLIILTIYAVIYLSERWSGVEKKLYIFLIIFTSFSTVFIFNTRLEETFKNNPWYYIKSEMIAALDSLPTGNLYSKNVLASYYIGNNLPSHSFFKVYFGHLIQTDNSEQKIERMYNFYSNKYSEEQAKIFLKVNNINYIWYGPDEKDITLRLGSESKLKYGFLKIISNFGNTEIYSY